MKRFIFFVLLTALAVIFAPWLGPDAKAAEKTGGIDSIVFAVEMDEYYINGETPGVGMDAEAFIENGRTYVPVRYLCHALGVSDDNIAWDGETQKVTLVKNGDIVELAIGAKKLWLNGEPREMDVAPVLKSDPAWRTYLPARYVAEALDFKVDWDGNSRTVMCWPAEEDKPDISDLREYAGKPEMVRFIDDLHDQPIMKGSTGKDQHGNWMHQGWASPVLWHYPPDERPAGVEGVTYSWSKDILNIPIRHSEEVFLNLECKSIECEFLDISYEKIENNTEEIPRIRAIIEKLAPDVVDEVMNNFEEKRKLVLEATSHRNAGIAYKNAPVKSQNGTIFKIFGVIDQWAKHYNSVEMYIAKPCR